MIPLELLHCMLIGKMEMCTFVCRCCDVDDWESELFAVRVTYIVWWNGYGYEINIEENAGEVLRYATICKKVVDSSWLFARN